MTAQGSGPGAGLRRGTKNPVPARGTVTESSRTRNVTVVTEA